MKKEPFSLPINLYDMTLFHFSVFPFCFAVADNWSGVVTGKRSSIPSLSSKPIPGSSQVLFPFHGNTPSPSLSSAGSPFSQGRSPWSTPSPGQHSARLLSPWQQRSHSPNTSSHDSNVSQSSNVFTQGQSSDSSGSGNKVKTGTKDTKVTFRIGESGSSANNSVESGFSENQSKKKSNTNSYADVCNKCLGSIDACKPVVKPKQNTEKGRPRSGSNLSDTGSQGHSPRRDKRQYNQDYDRGRNSYNYDGQGQRSRGQYNKGYNRGQGRGSNRGQGRGRFLSGDYNRSNSDPKPRTHRALSDGDTSSSEHSKSEGNTQSRSRSFSKDEFEKLDLSIGTRDDVSKDDNNDNVDTSGQWEEVHSPRYHKSHKHESESYSGHQYWHRDREGHDRGRGYRGGADVGYHDRGRGYRGGAHVGYHDNRQSRGRSEGYHDNGRGRNHYDNYHNQADRGSYRGGPSGRNMNDHRRGQRYNGSKSQKEYTNQSDKDNYSNNQEDLSDRPHQNTNQNAPSGQHKYQRQNAYKSDSQVTQESFNVAK